MKIEEKIKYYRGFDLDRDKYSVHTFEMCTKISKREYDCLLEILSSYDHEQKVIEGNDAAWDGEEDISIVSTMYSVRKDTGISRFRLYRIEPFDQYYLTFSCNARVLLQIEELPFVCIIEPKDIKRIYDRLREVFDALGILEVVPVEWLYFKRVDFCTNVKMESVEAADIYMGLLAKGRAIYHSKRKMTMYAGEANRMNHPKSLKWTGRSFEIEIYEKYDMMEDQQLNYGYDAEEVEEAKNRIRFEVRVDGRCIAQMKKRCGYLSNEEFMNMSCWNSAKLITRNLVQMYGCGDFVSFKMAAEIIKNSRCYQQTKDILLEFITELAKLGATVDSAYEAYLGKLKAGRTLQLFEIMKHFNHLGISPITIPDELEEYQCFRNPVCYIDQRNANYE